MGSVTTCPACGFVAGGIRCPRCNALKVTGCSGSCTLCKSKCTTAEKTGRERGDSRTSHERPNAGGAR